MNGTNQDEELKENESSTEPAEIEAEVKHSLSTDPATIEAEMNQELANVGTTYSGLKENADTFYEGQKTEAELWGAKQQALQQQRTDLAIEQINQQKEQSAKDYAKEQSGAYTDWQKESNKYGANAEKMAAGGLAGSGYSESARVQMYNTYQNRVAAAREAYNMATLNYNNAIKDAQLQNSSALAQIAYDTYQQQLALTMQAFQFENELVLAEASKRLEIQSMYHGQYMDALTQQNWQTEYDRVLELDKSEADRWQAEYDLKAAAQDAEAVRWKKEYDLKVAAQDLEKEQFDFLYGGAEIGEPGETITPEEAEEIENAGAEAARKGIANRVNPVMSRTTTKQDIANMYPSDPNKEYPNMEVTTNYYRGPLNEDAHKYGTFDNGYQPKGIGDIGEVKKTDMTIEVRTKNIYGPNAGKATKVTQSVWETPDGRLWYWDGVNNKYENYYSYKK